MEKVNLKKYIFRISLIFILLVSVFLCGYAVQHYKSNNTMVQNNQFRREGNMPSNMPNGANPPQNMPSLNDNSNSNNNNDQSKNSQADSSGDTASANAGKQFGGNRNNQSGQNEGAKSAFNGNDQISENKNEQSNSNDNKQQRSNNKNMQSGKQSGNMQRGSADTKYVPALTIYSVIFLILSCGIYYLVRFKKIEFNFVDEKFLIFILLAVGFFLRVAASTLMDGHNDVNLFKNWASVAANDFLRFYSNARQADYPPLYMYILGLIGKLAALPALNSYYVLMLKIPSIIADIVTSYFIYKLGKKYFSSVISIFLAAFYIFNPAIFIDSTFWGQVDSFFTILIVVAVFLLSEKKYVFSSIMFAVAVLMKPQGIIFLPILFFELVRERKIKNFIYAVASAMMTALIIIIPFSLNQHNPLWIFNLYSKTISEYPYASVNAFNFFSLIGANYKNNNTTLVLFSYHTIGMIFIVITTLISWFVYIKGNDRKYISAIALFQIAGVFTFSVGMHERYLFPAVALSILAFIYLKDRRFFILSIGFSITSYTNISVVFFSMNSSTFNIFLKEISFLNVLLVGYLVKILFDNVVKKVSLEFVK